MINIANSNTQKFSPIVNRYDGSSPAPWKWVTVTGSKNALPIKISPPYDTRNEIGTVQNGDRIQIRDDQRSGSYVWAFVDSLKKGGWVDSNCIK